MANIAAINLKRYFTSREIYESTRKPKNLIAMKDNELNCYIANQIVMFGNPEDLECHLSEKIKCLIELRIWNKIPHAEKLKLREKSEFEIDAWGRDQIRKYL